MRLVSTIAAIFVAIAVPSYAQEQLKVGDSYSGNVKLGSSNGGLFLALPQGTWVLTSFEKTISRPEVHGVVQMIRGRLISTDKQKRVVGIVQFSSGIADTGFWEKPRYCYRKDTYFLHAESGRRNQEMRCWGVHATGMGVPTATAPVHVKEFYQYVASKGIKLPQTMVVVDVHRASGVKFLNATYFRNPELDGIRGGPPSTWQKDVADQRRLQYLESTKTWAEQRQATFEAAFAGRPK